jgi:hypothetical protein
VIPLFPPPALTILVPAHNEEDIIAASVVEGSTQVIVTMRSSRPLVVDGAGIGGTPGVLAPLARPLPDFNLVRLEPSLHIYLLRSCPIIENDRLERGCISRPAFVQL